MRIEARFLRSRVSRRVFGLFVLAAVVPILAMAILSFGEVNRILLDQTNMYLHESSKSIGLTIFERLAVIESRMSELSYLITSKNTHAIKNVIGEEHFSGIALIKNNKMSLISGDVEEPPPMTKDAMGHLRSGKIIVQDRVSVSGIAHIYAYRLMEDGNDKSGMLIGRINPEFLWGNPQDLPYAISQSVFSPASGLLNGTSELPIEVVDTLLHQTQTRSRGQLKWNSGEEVMLGRYWSLFLRARFFNDGWIVMSAQPTRLALSPVAGFRRIFPPVLLLSILLVLYLSLTYVRRSLVPLEKLIERTREIANRNFDNPVIIKSGDEFEELADSLNAMASRLGRQFNTLSTLAEMDRLILTSADTDPVVEIVMRQIEKIVPCAFVGIAVFETDAPGIARNHVKAVGEANDVTVDRVQITNENRRELMRCSKGLMVDFCETDRVYTKSLVDMGAMVCYALPVVRKNQLYGILTLGFESAPTLSSDYIRQAHEIADRLAVAMASVEKEEELYRQAHFDPLTGLANRQLFKDRLSQELVHARRDGNKVGLLFVDLDRFKQVNDSVGHSAGDTLLKLAADRLRRCVRETDTVARLGGDEFTIILNSIMAPRDANIIADQINKIFSKPFNVGGIDHYVSASIGITIYPEDGMTAEALLRNADTAMYRAKDSGRATRKFFTEEMNVAAVRRTRFEADLRHAIDRDELEMYYQPQIETRSGSVAGVEALIRWQPQSGSMIMPSVFIPIAEDTGMIERIGRWALEASCKQFAEWRASGLSLQTISVNVSAKQVTGTGFVDMVKQVIESTGMEADNLELEITESVLVDDRQNAARTLNDLKELGVRLSIDDFGTGYSSLNYLRKYTIDTLKIDRSFIEDIGSDYNAKILAAAIIAMGHSLEKRVVAEGVETREQLEFLAGRRCDLVQGYLFGKPMTAEQFRKFADRTLIPNALATLQAGAAG